MLTTIKGIYDHGKITLTEELPLEENKMDVLVTFLPEQKVKNIKPKRILGGLEGKISVPENFNEPLSDLKDYI